MEEILSFIPQLAQGALVTFQVTLAAIPFYLLIAFVIGSMRLSKNWLLYAIATVYVEIIRGTPFLVQLFYIFFVLPFAGFRIEPFPAAVAALSINLGAYVSEVVRAGFQGVSKGQREAAIALRMPRWLTFRRIIFPQAIRIMLPPLGNSVIELLKGTAVVSLVAIHELTYQGTVLTKETFETAIIWLLVASFYFIMSYPSTFVIKWLERRTAFP